MEPPTHLQQRLIERTEHHLEVLAYQESTLRELSRYKLMAGAGVAGGVGLSAYSFLAEGIGLESLLSLAAASGCGYFFQRFWKRASRISSIHSELEAHVKRTLASDAYAEAVRIADEYRASARGTLRWDP